jgi:xanthine dehydrogenase large subunit
VRLFKARNVKDSIHHSKAVGEPPLVHGISVFNAIADALSSLGDGRESPDLCAPATPEAILKAAEGLRRPGAVTA